MRTNQIHVTSSSASPSRVSLGCFPVIAMGALAGLASWAFLNYTLQEATQVGILVSVSSILGIPLLVVMLGGVTASAVAFLHILRNGFDTRS